jgi:hypothetical protein
MDNIILVKNDGTNPDIDDTIMTIDNVISYDMYKPMNNTLMIYEYMKNLFAKNNFNRTTILSDDISIASSVITGLAEKTMKTFTKTIDDKERIIYESELRVFYFGNNCRLNIKEYENHLDFQDSVISNMIGITDTFTNHKVNINPKNLHLFINEVTENDSVIIGDNDIEFYEFDLIRKKGFERVIEHICKENMYYPVSVIFDFDILPIEINKNEITINELDIILENIKKLKSLMSINICSYSFKKNDPRNKIKREIILKIIEEFDEIKKNRINIFSDDSKFLIWRKRDDDTHGWNILRGVDLDFKNTVLDSIDENTIIELEIDDAYCQISSTSIKEQNGKSFYKTKDVNDLCLFPQEKIDMVFEMLSK